MILMLLLDVFYTVFGFIFGIVFPDIPLVIVNSALYVMNFIFDGLDILFYMFISPELVTALLTFMVTLWGILFTIDIVWMIIKIVRGNY
mgnify:CR=1 FL=1